MGLELELEIGKDDGKMAGPRQSSKKKPRPLRARVCFVFCAVLCVVWRGVLNRIKGSGL